MNRAAQIRSGGRTRRSPVSALIAAELRLQAARDDAHELRRALLRLRADVRDHLRHPCAESCARLRHELQTIRLREEKAA